LKGNAKEAAKGIARGFKGLLANTTVGISNSVQKISGTLYMSLKNLSGKDIPEGLIDNPVGIGSGIAHGAKGLVREIGSGVAGVYKVPRQRINAQGWGCAPLAIGTC
jgi:hypothetical protein